MMKYRKNVPHNVLNWLKKSMEYNNAPEDTENSQEVFDKTIKKIREDMFDSEDEISTYRGIKHEHRILIQVLLLEDEDYKRSVTCRVYAIVSRRNRLKQKIYEKITMNENGDIQQVNELTTNFVKIINGGDRIEKLSTLQERTFEFFV